MIDFVPNQEINNKQRIHPSKTRKARGLSLPI
jgi:hypothetical protein